jgi:hypothetical protein
MTRFCVTWEYWNGWLGSCATGTVSPRVKFYLVTGWARQIQLETDHPVEIAGILSKPGFREIESWSQTSATIPVKCCSLEKPAALEVWAGGSVPAIQKPPGCQARRRRPQPLPPPLAIYDRISLTLIDAHQGQVGTAHPALAVDGVANCIPCHEKLRPGDDRGLVVPPMQRSAVARQFGDHGAIDPSIRTR